MREFLDDNAPLWERLGYASEADYHEAQARRAREAKEQRAREAAQRHAAAGRDYGVIKRINKRAKAREKNRRWYANNLDRARELGRAKYQRRIEYERSRNRQRHKRFTQNKQWWLNRLERMNFVRQMRKASDPSYRERLHLQSRERWQKQKTAHPDQLAQYHAKNLAAVRRYQAKKRATDPEWYERRVAKARESHARKRAEKLAAQQQQDEQQSS